MRFLCRSLSDSAMTSRVTSFRSTASIADSFLVNRARTRAITSEARLPSRIVRRAVSRALDVRRVLGEHPQAGAGVSDDARERLVHFVRDGGGQSTEGGGPGYVCELGLCPPERLLRQPPCCHVLNGTDVLQSSVVISAAVGNHVHILNRLV